jgi:hypothetical protein
MLLARGRWQNAGTQDSCICWVSVLLDFAMIFDGFQVIGGSGKKGRRKSEGSTEFHIYLA